MQNILCNVRRPIPPILIAKVWRRNLDCVKNLQVKYFASKNILIYGTSWLQLLFFSFFTPSLPLSSPLLPIPSGIQSSPPQVLGRGAHDKLIRISQESLSTKAGILGLVWITIATLLQLTLEFTELFNELLLFTSS